MVNRLSRETSPYLLQHAEQPIHWQAWSDEVFERAQRENKLVFLSVGYSTCHWCHVMAHETFDDEGVADILNQNYISVKVDREERLDVDATFMSYLQLTTGHGGWPMSLWLTPNGKAIVGGTYFPKEDAEGRLGFKNICLQILELWKSEPERALGGADQVFEEMQRRANHLDVPVKPSAADENNLSETIELFAGQFDRENGGFSHAPKFPRPVVLDYLGYLLRSDKALESKEVQPLERMYQFTLLKMVEGGMYDHLAGGFHRYSVDAHWQVPHFEKMLYDQAQLLFTYAEAFFENQFTSFSPVEATLEYLESVLISEGGGYFSGEDADSVDSDGKKKEGAYWVWTSEEVYQVIKAPRDAAIISCYLGVQHGGNVDPALDPHGELLGKNVLSKAASMQELSTQFDLPLEQISEILKVGKAALKAVRDTRPLPHKDDKIIAAWNAYLLKAFSFIALKTQEDKWKDLARKLKDSIIELLWDGQQLYRSSREGKRSVAAFAQDYLALIDALLFYRSIDSDAAIDRLIFTLLDTLERDFWDPQNAAFKLSLSIQNKEVFSMVEDYDGAEVSSLSLALSVYSRLVTLHPESPCEKQLNLLVEKAKSLSSGNAFMSPAVVKELLIHQKGRRLIQIGENVDPAHLASKLTEMHSEDQIISIAGNDLTLCENNSCKKF